MATVATYPIKRLDIDFIKSNITSFDNIVKITIVKNPGLVGNISSVSMSRFIIDPASQSFFDDNFQLLQYMSTGVYMSESIYMGGLDILNTVAKDTSQLKIDGSIQLKSFRFLLDYVLNASDIVLYTLSYTYNGGRFQTPAALSYKPLVSNKLATNVTRPNSTIRNLRYRGSNESEKYNDMHKENFADIRNLNNILEQAK